MKHLKILLIGLMAILLAACGGGSGGSLFGEDGSSGGDGSGGGTNGGETPALSNNTYYPLNLYYNGEGYVKEDAIDFFFFPNFTMAYLLSPIDARTLEPAVNPKLADFELLINNKKPVMDEHLPLMQKVVGLPVQLNTALVIDASASNKVNKTALIAAIKQYITAAKADSDPVIRNQQYSLWVFGTRVKPLLLSFTSNENDIEAELTTFFNGQSNVGGGTALYQSIVAAVGWYEGKGSIELTQEYNYKLVNPKGEVGVDPVSQIMLIDGYRAMTEIEDLDKQVLTNSTLEKLVLSNIVLFASGQSSEASFDEEAAKAALNWQTLLQFDLDAPLGGVSSDDDDDTPAPDSFDPIEGMTYSGKPLYYISLGINNVVPEVKSLATLTIDTNSTDTFNFSSQLITQQKNDLKARSRLDNMYMVRHLFFERDGTVTSQFSSKTNYRDYRFTHEITLDPDNGMIGTSPDQDPQLEITTVSNDFIAGGQVSVSKINKLYPAARWDLRNNHQSGNVWTVDGNVRPAAADGSITITTTDVGKMVLLSNNNLSTSLRIVP